MNIKQSVQNTFKRVGIDYEEIQRNSELMKSIHGIEPKVEVRNRFSGESCEVSPLVATCIQWVYRTSNKYEEGDHSVKVSDFDRVRYFVLEVDKDAYYTCID